MTTRSVTGWFEKYGKVLQGVAAVSAALIALAALIGVKVQIDAAARAQQVQSARDIYREFLNLSINKPEFAEPDYCAIKGGAQDAAYKNYLEYLLYTSEQILSVAPEWDGALTEHLAAHDQYLCNVPDWSDYPATVRAIVTRVKVKCVRNPSPAADREARLNSAIRHRPVASALPLAPA